MGSQNFGYKPGDPIKVGDLNNLLNFQHNISTDNGVVGRDGAYFQTQPTNEQSLADLSYRDFSMTSNPVRSHSVIYGVKDGTKTKWYHERKPGSQAYYTLGNVSIETVGTQKLDKWGTPVYNDQTGQPEIGEFGNKYMVAVQAMVPGMKYVLRCDYTSIRDSNALKNGDLCYWGGWDGLRKLGDSSNSKPEFSVVRYEYNPAPLSPQDTYDPLLDLRTRELFWEGQIFVSTENYVPKPNTNLEDTYYLYLGNVTGIVFVQTDLNTGGNDIDINAVLNEYQYLDATNFEISPALEYMGEAVSGNTNTVFYKGQEYYLVPYMYSLGDCWQSDDGFVYSSVTGKIHPGFVPRLPKYNVADTINDLGMYQDDFENTLQTYWSVPKWDMPVDEDTGQLKQAHQVFMPTEYANPAPTGYAECIYHPIEEVEEKVVTNVAKVILPISKMLRSDIDPRPNVYPKVNAGSDTYNEKVPASFYSAKAMGLIEPTNSNPVPQVAYHYINQKLDTNVLVTALNSLKTELSSWDVDNDQNPSGTSQHLMETYINGIKTLFPGLFDDIIDGFTGEQQSAYSKEQLQALLEQLTNAVKQYDCFPGFIEVPFCLYKSIQVDKDEFHNKERYTVMMALLDSFKGLPYALVTEQNVNTFFPKWDLVVIDKDESGNNNTNGTNSNSSGTASYTIIVNGVYLSTSDKPVPIALTAGGNYCYMQKVELDTTKADDTNFKSPRYKTFADRKINSITTDGNCPRSTGGWTAYRYLSDNPEMTEDISEETFTLVITDVMGIPLLESTESGEETPPEENPSEPTPPSGGSSSNGDNVAETKAKLRYGTANKSVTVNMYRFLPLAFFNHSGTSGDSQDEDDDEGNDTGSNSTTDYEKIYGKFSIKDVNYTKEGVSNKVVCYATISFKPAKGKDGKKLYNDVFSLPFLPHKDLVRSDTVEENVPLCSPRHPMAITTKPYKAQRSDWIPAMCRNLDQNEVLIPGMLVSYKKATTTLTQCSGGEMAELGDFVYGEIESPPEYYSTVTEGTPNYVIYKIEYKTPTLSESTRGVISDEDVYVTNVEVVDEIPPFNITGNEYYIGVKLDSNGYPDIREPFGGFRDCDNLGNMTVFFRTTAYNISFTCTGRLDFIPFGYAVPSRTPSCYYKTANDDCAVNFVNTRYIMKRINDSGIENQLFLSGACYVPCSALTSLGSND